MWVLGARARDGGRDRGIGEASLSFIVVDVVCCLVMEKVMCVCWWWSGKREMEVMMDGKGRFDGTFPRPKLELGPAGKCGGRRHSFGSALAPSANTPFPLLRLRKHHQELKIDAVKLPSRYLIPMGVLNRRTGLLRTPLPNPTSVQGHMSLADQSGGVKTADRTLEYPQYCLR